tara:strand:+ start:58 stop:327 length:270 start_codon:yes stop_codon:yes gene_type:complete
MRTLYTAALSALLCSLVWIGGTTKLLDEYIKVIDQKDSRIAQLERKTGQDRNTIIKYDIGLRQFLFKCTTKQEILIERKRYVCYPIEKA